MLALWLYRIDLELLTFLQEHKANGRSLVLVTASHRKFAEQIAAHLGLFDAVLASDDDRNLSGAHEAEELVRRYGERGFDYAGNAAVDLAVWRCARRAMVINASASLVKQASTACEVEQVFSSENSPRVMAGSRRCGWINGSRTD